MEITWYGRSCFRLAERGSATVVTDPDDSRQAGAGSLKLGAEIVTVSHAPLGQDPLEAIQGAPYVITGPGEYEVGGVFITGIQTGRQKGADSIQNTLYVFDFDSLTVAHLGDLDRILTQAEIEAIGTVNVALVPVGGERTLTPARAAEVISLLEPNLVVPIYDPPPGGASSDSLSKFLKEMGIDEAVRQPSLKVTKTTLPEETRVIILEDQRG